MAMQLATQTLDSGVGFDPTWIERMIAHRRYVKHARRVYAELDTYTDRELADLGFSRADIWEVALEDARLKLDIHGHPNR